MNAPRFLNGFLIAASLAFATPAFGDEPPAPAPAPEPAPPPAPEVPPPPKPLEFHNESLIERNLPPTADKPGTRDVVYFYRTNFVKADQLQAGLKLLGVDALGITVELAPAAYTQGPQLGPQSPPSNPTSANSLVFKGSAEAVEMALDAAAYFDVPAPQVFIEAKVIEITYESNFEFGLDYLWNRSANGPDTLFRGADAVLSPPSAIAAALPGGLPFQGTSLLWGFVGTNAMKFGDLDLAIQAMQLEGKAEILSKPSLVVTQGVVSRLSTEENLPVPAFAEANNTNVTYRAAPVNTGVTMNVTATHIGESFVTMDIEPIVRGVAGLAASRGGTLQPITTTRSARTTVTMGDGETLVIGGLYSNSHITEKAKTPLLSEIPLLGALFTRTRETKAKTELVFLLTPHIVQKTSELRIITPPSELERLEATGPEAYCPVGPHLPPLHRKPAAVAK